MGHLLWKGDLKRFLFELKRIHGDNYDPKDVTNEHIQDVESHVPLWCVKGNHPYNPTINGLINAGRGCPCLSDLFPWKGDLERFLSEMKRIHGDDYDPKDVTREHIQGVNSHIPLWCVQGNHPRISTIDLLINIEVGCPCLTKGLPWKGDLERFLSELKRIHGDNYDSKDVTRDHLQTGESHVSLRCVKGNHPYNPTIQSLINGEHGCRCYTHTGYSKVSIECFTYISHRDNINIQHAENGGEHYIPGVGHVDGFYDVDKTVYGFHGDRYHGNPRKYKPDYHDPHLKKPMGELHRDTLARDNRIRSLGYNLVVIWEDEWEALKRSLKKPMKTVPNIMLLNYKKT